MKNNISSDQLLVAIDVGTTKICVLIAQKIGTALEIIGIGKAPSCGIARGVVVDIAAAVQTIKTALREAELMAGCSVESVAVGISGSHIQAINSQGLLAIKRGEIRDHDINHVIATARAVSLPEGQQILHVLPQFFTIDGHHRVKDPRGMHGVRLEAQVHIITGAVASVQNLVRCCEMAGVKVRDIILEPLASADAVLSADERELGVAVLDIGGGTADFAVYQNNSIRHTHIIPMAGAMFTNDIALCLKTTLKEAERIKKEFGLASTMLLDENHPITILKADGLDHNVIWQHELAQVLEARASELMSLVRKEISTYHLESLMPMGLVLTGGGSLLAGMQSLSNSILEMPVRVGKPHIPLAFKEALDSPIYATGYGLLVHMFKKEEHEQLALMSGPLVHRVFSRMRSWVMDFF